jgi:hypothetical protein
VDSLSAPVVIHVSCVCILHLYKVQVLNGSVDAVSQYCECQYNHYFRVESVTGLKSCLLCSMWNTV